MGRSIAVVAWLGALSGTAGAEQPVPVEVVPARCTVRTPGATISADFRPTTSLQQLVTWVRGFSCKGFVFDGDALARGASLAPGAIDAVTLARAHAIFVETVRGAGLVVVERPDRYVIKLAPSAKRTCFGGAAPITPPPVVTAEVIAPPSSCTAPAAGAQLQARYSSAETLESLATWLANAICKPVQIEGDVPRRGIELTAIVPDGVVTPKQAIALFADAADAAGLIAAVRADGSVSVKLGPAWPAGCPDKPLPPPQPAIDEDARNALLDANLRKLGENHYQVTRALVTRVLQDPQLMLLRGARVVPAMKNGRPQGYKLYALRPSSLFVRLGATNGDTVVSIGGRLLVDEDSVRQVLEQLQRLHRVEIELVRRGEPVVISISIVK